MLSCAIAHYAKLIIYAYFFKAIDIFSQAHVLCIFSPEIVRLACLKPLQQKDIVTKKTPPKGVKKLKPKIEKNIIKSKEVTKSSNKAKDVEFLPVNPVGVCSTALPRFLSDDAY